MDTPKIAFKGLPPTLHEKPLLETSPALGEVVFCSRELHQAVQTFARVWNSEPWVAASRRKLVAWPLARASPDPAFASRQQAGLRGKGRSPRRFLRHRGRRPPGGGGAGEPNPPAPYPNLCPRSAPGSGSALPGAGVPEGPACLWPLVQWRSKKQKTAGGDAPLPSSLRHLGGAPETYFRRGREPWRCWTASARPASAQRFLRYPGSRALAFSVFKVSCDSTFPFYIICTSLFPKKTTQKKLVSLPASPSRDALRSE